ncbi:MAG: glutamate--tRNA ligase family protein [Bryobacteraceae bacterium]
MLRARFAPSPAGYLHIGSTRTFTEARLGVRARRARRIAGRSQRAIRRLANA